MIFTDPTTHEKFSITELCNLLKTKISKKNNIYIGADSQERGDKIIIATAVIVYNHNKGGTYFYNREILNAKYFKSLRQRLMYEIQKSTETAICLMELDELCDKFSVHIDINSDNRFKSSIVLKEAKSYILSQGFECETKPNSWASSCVADKLTKIRPK